jgi:hypothetical protein
MSTDAITLTITTAQLQTPVVAKAFIDVMPHVISSSTTDGVVTIKIGGGLKGDEFMKVIALYAALTENRAEPSPSSPSIALSKLVELPSPNNIKEQVTVPYVESTTAKRLKEIALSLEEVQRSSAPVTEQAEKLIQLLEELKQISPSSPFVSTAELMINELRAKLLPLCDTKDRACESTQRLQPVTVVCPPPKINVIYVKEPKIEDDVEEPQRVTVRCTPKAKDDVEEPQRVTVRCTPKAKDDVEEQQRVIVRPSLKRCTPKAKDSVEDSKGGSTAGLPTKCPLTPLRAACKPQEPKVEEKTKEPSPIDLEKVISIITMMSVFMPHGMMSKLVTKVIDLCPLEVRIVLPLLGINPNEEDNQKLLASVTALLRSLTPLAMHIIDCVVKHFAGPTQSPISLLGEMSKLFAQTTTTSPSDDMMKGMLDMLTKGTATKY